jgi:hypothetical protein
MNCLNLYKFAVCSISFLFLGCAIVAPVHEAEPPETLGPWGFRINMVTATGPTLAPTQALNSTESSSLKQGLGGARLGVGIGSNLQLNVEALLTTAVGGASSASLKYQWNGSNAFAAKAGNTVTSTVLRAWSSSAIGAAAAVDPTNTVLEYVDLKGTGYDLTQLVGTRWTDSFGGYIGPKVMTAAVRGDYRSDKNGPILSSRSRSVSGGGAVLGLYWAPHSARAGFDLTLEGQAMNLPATFTNDRVWYTTWALMLGVPLSFAGTN